jgi:hypothetical protein
VIKDVQNQKVFSAAALWATVAILCSACSVDTISSKDVSTDAIHQDLSMSYSEETNTTYLSAQFRVGGSTGTTVDLEEPANLKLNGQTPSKQNILGTRYQVSQPGFVRMANFEYKTKEETVLKNTISIEPMFLRKAEATASVLQTYVIELEVPALARGEEISVRMVQEIRKADMVQYQYADGVFDAGKSRASFSPAELSKLNNGLAKVQISRRKSTRVEQGTREGGFISASYNLRPISVNIVDKSAGLYIPLAKN